MSVARKLERRLEKIFDTVAGKVFSGRLHPSEMSGRLAREADFARFEHEAGPATANRYVIVLNPRDITPNRKEMTSTLRDQLEAHITEEGLRLEGPLAVAIEASEDVRPGEMACHVEVEPGEQVPWARLIGHQMTYPVGRNRSLIGRSPGADTVIDHDDVSRRHALIFRESGSVWITDLGSANGTAVDGHPIGSMPVKLVSGSVVSLAGHDYRFREI